MVFLLSFLAFFAGFRYNAWKVLEHNRLPDNQGESMAVGRLVKSRTDGVFSAAGLCGRCNDGPKDSSLFAYQFTAYENDIPCKKFEPYLSQIGFHAAVYSMIDSISPFSSKVTLNRIRDFKSATLAMVMSFILLWFFLEMGLLPAIFVFFGVLLTPWFTFLGRDLLLCVWTNYLPFLVALFLLRKENTCGKLSEFKILLCSSLAILANFIFNGYEWVTTTLIMASVPFFYYWKKDNWPLKKLVRRISWLVAGSLASLLVSFSILIFQISKVKGSFSTGIDWLIFSFQKRTYGSADQMPEIIEKQLDHSILEVFKFSFGGAAFLLPSFLADHLSFFFNRIFFAEIVFLLMILTFLLFYKSNFLNLSSEKIQTPKNLAIISWISILAPLSWSVIFKGHAWSHYHINYITWFMPFGLFVMALAGATISAMIRRKGNVHTLSVR